MIRIRHEGDESGPFITYVHVSDGGFGIVIKLWRLWLYCRRRGPNNPAKPKHMFDVDWVCPAWERLR
jgi:hypothetical protein